MSAEGLPAGRGAGWAEQCLVGLAAMRSRLATAPTLEEAIAVAADSLVAVGVPLVLVFAPPELGGELLHGRCGGAAVAPSSFHGVTFLSNASTPSNHPCPVRSLPEDLRAALRALPSEPCDGVYVVPVTSGTAAFAATFMFGVPAPMTGDPAYSAFASLVAAEVARLPRLVDDGRKSDMRVSAHRAAEGSAVFHRDVVTQAPVAICMLHGPEHTTSLANEQLVALFAREVGAVPFARLFADDDADEIGALLDRAYASDAVTVANEIRVERGDRTLFVNLACAPYRDSAGLVSGLLVAATDVTETVNARVNVERLADLLQRGEARLQQALVAADAGTWELDLFSGRESADGRYRELLGVSPTGPLPEDLGAIHPEDRPRVRAAEARALDRLEGLLVEFRPLANPSRWIELRGEMMQGPKARSARLVGIAVDVTPRKHAETARAELLVATAQAKRAFERLGETVPQQLWTARPDGLLDFVNARVTEYFGASAEAMLAAGWKDFVHPEDVDHVLEKWVHSLTSGEPYDLEFRLRGPDGAYRWHLARAVPFRDEGGSITKWFGTNTDIDELKRTREELERRTSYEQHLIGIVSHDLRGPLHSIGLATGLLHTLPDLPPAAARPIRAIETSAQRASRLVRDILDFTRARLVGGIPIDARPFDLREVLEPAVSQAIDGFPGRRVDIRVEGELHGRWDGDRVSQVLQNGLTNALRYSTPGSVVHLSAHGRATDVELVVANSGPPIASDVLAKVFQPMTRGTDESSKGHRGVGLGLFIVREIVAAHGGSVRLLSDESGTRLVVTLPRER